ncbi:DUF4838 domain-containing protein [Candidatus Bathyarchaeota archaeon]|nr:DUF4838 domain-containing protein [Candidatus Bathyarchaeota archaeon]
MVKDEIVLVLDGEPEASIIAPNEGPLAYAASELQRYVWQMSNAELPIAEKKTYSKESCIVFHVSTGSVKHDGYVVYVRGDDVIIEASEERGCIYGAYALLEQLGCRFYGPEPLGEVVPKYGTLTLQKRLNIICEPAFINRIPSSGTPEQQIKWGFNFTPYISTCEGRQRVKKLGLKTYTWGHFWPLLIGMRFFPDGRKPEKMDYKGREDWLPLDENGVRRLNPPWHFREGGQSLCFSNPQAFDWFVENTVNWIMTECHDADYVNIWSADTMQIALCQCSKCVTRFSTGDYQHATDWYLHIQNEIRQRLNEHNWRGTLGWIAYHGSEEPPVYVNLLDEGSSMDFLYAPRPRGGGQHGPFVNDHQVNLRYRHNLQRWLSYLNSQNYKGTKTVFEYYYDLVLLGNLATGRTFLIPKHETLQMDMQFYHKQGFEGFFDCNPPADAWFPDPLSRWLYHRLLWNPHIDLKAARADFFKHYYGTAANLMRDLREKVEHLMFEKPTRKVVDELYTLEGKISDIMPIAGCDDILVTRVKGMKLWIQYCALCKDSEFHEKITHHKEEGRNIELAIRELLEKHDDFLVGEGFMSKNDIAYLAGEVVNRHLRIFE